ncbi:uncharacterized protein LOC114469958 [Gouania willdenowi]|uniref:uncharacterized protein LOC114469958 n=1 Tax=Gouania willdenowi TaxID=441366 RepID=UPI001055FC7C|nr:uncharacterized protein LOC114469958 [Gouania willdenowi]
MSGVLSPLLTFPQCEGGSRTLRFIYLVNSSSFSLTEGPHKDGVMPLYLGADLLSNTEIRTENHPRFHAKFAKRGLATKVEFSSAFRFQGLKVPVSNNSLWFYSIQGLFRVAFEMFSKQEQLAVMEKFQDIWKSHINDGPLSSSYSLNVQLDARNTTTQTEVPQLNDSHIEKTSMEAGGSDVSADVSADHDYCSSKEDKEQPLVSVFRQKLRSLDERLSCEPPGGTELLDTISLLLDITSQFLDGTLEEKAVSEAVLVLLKAKDWTSVYTSSLLTCVARWLGQQFHAAYSSISERVEGFKVQHIERISDLPPAEELASELFPEAMQKLLLHWMGLSDDSTLEKRRSEYPILLLILEFTNHNLITGVAHVLYSSLICK